MRIYLAGPMRGIKDFNFPAFHEAEANLTFAGHEVFSPASYEERIYGVGFAKSATGDLADLPVEFSLRASLAEDVRFISTQADAVAVLPGWEKSKGAQAEVALARALGLPVLYIADLEPVDFSPLPLPLPPGYSSETIITDADTGGQKGQKLERFDLIPMEPFEELACVYGRGAKKYADDNWRKGYSWRLSIGAMFRHAVKFCRGESRDEMGNHHLACVAWHCFTLMWFEKNRPEKDDRAK